MITARALKLKTQMLSTLVIHSMTLEAKQRLRVLRTVDSDGRSLRSTHNVWPLSFTSASK